MPRFMRCCSNVFPENLNVKSLKFWLNTFSLACKIRPIISSLLEIFIAKPLETSLLPKIASGTKRGNNYGNVPHMHYGKMCFGAWGAIKIP